MFFESFNDCSQCLPTGFEVSLSSNPRTSADRPETTEGKGEMIVLDGCQESPGEERQLDVEALGLGCFFWI